MKEKKPPAPTAYVTFVLPKEAKPGILYQWPARLVYEAAALRRARVRVPPAPLIKAINMLGATAAFSIVVTSQNKKGDKDGGESAIPVRDEST